MTVTFCGHGNNFYDEEIKRKLYDETEKLIIAGATKTLRYAIKKEKQIIRL